MLADYDLARARGRARACAFVVATVLDALVEGVWERIAPAWMDPEARARARRWQVKAMLEAWKRDFAFAVRSLSRAPGFTLVVVATLALAIGANTAIFSVVKAVLLEPLPFPNADRLVHIGGTAPGTDQPREFGVPDELYFEYRESVPAHRGHRALRHRLVHDARGRAGRPALLDAGDAVVLHDARRTAPARAAAHRRGRRPRRRPQPLAVAGPGSTPIRG